MWHHLISFFLSILIYQLHDHAKHLETESFTELFDLLELLVEAIKSKEVETDLIAAKVKSFFRKEAGR